MQVQIFFKLPVEWAEIGWRKDGTDFNDHVQTYDDEVLKFDECIDVSSFWYVKFKICWPGLYACRVYQVR